LRGRQDVGDRIPRISSGAIRVGPCGSGTWIPAFAGMTTTQSVNGEKRENGVKRTAWVRKNTEPILRNVKMGKMGWWGSLGRIVLQNPEKLFLWAKILDETEDICDKLNS
jgi:hypothetical protein